MEQSDFDKLIILYKKNVCENDAADITILYQLYKTTELRDFTWIIDDQSNLYNVLWELMIKIWEVSRLSTNNSNIYTNITTISDITNEYYLLEIWNYMVTLPEFDQDYVIKSTIFDEKLLRRLFYRIYLFCSQYIPMKIKYSTYIIQYLKNVLHWIYKYQLNHRILIKSFLFQYLTSEESLLDHGTDDTKSDGSNVTINHKLSLHGMSSTDAGNTKAHYNHLLDILYTIIAGLSTSIQTVDIKTNDINEITMKNINNQSNKSFYEYALKNYQMILSQYKHILIDILIPLHKPNEMTQWRDQIPILQTYHENLVRCIMKLVEKDLELSKEASQILYDTNININKSILIQSIELILSIWPEKYETNTPKQVLLLHELEILIENIVSFKDFQYIKKPLLDRLVRCIGTDADNIRPAQRALQIFKNKKILNLFLPLDYSCTSSSAYTSNMNNHNTNKNTNIDLTAKTFLPSNEENSMEEQYYIACIESLDMLLPALYRKGILSWNPTVNKMTALALNNLKDRNPNAFKESCLKFHKPGNSFHQSNHSLPQHTIRKPSSSTIISTIAEEKGPYKRSNMNNMLPPTNFHRPRVILESSPNPNDFISNSNNSNNSGNSGNMTKRQGWNEFSKSNPPPVTITGIAPWASNNNKQLTNNNSSMMNTKADHKNSITISSVATVLPSNSSSNTLKSIQSSNHSNEVIETFEVEKDGYELVLEYITKCLPTNNSTNTNDGSNSSSQKEELDWNIQQASISATLLPTLKFHELVFGNILGEGAFSTVKYARHITKDKTQSSWPEYAVKIIPSNKINELQYRTSVIREMAVLQLLNHPGIARLISAFRYKDSAYLVLEYASRGDLHSYLVTNGKLEHLQCRFVIGEVVAALYAIHELGLSFGDLKPENILITQLGHVKITDFGACRPITNTAKDILIQSSHILDTIRNGDWKEDSYNNNDHLLINQYKHDIHDNTVRDDKNIDIRLEGTPAYLPPEVLYDKINIPGFTTDAWALGCLTYFCIYGRPKYFGDKEQVIQQIIQTNKESSEDLLDNPSAAVHFLDEKDTTIGSSTVDLQRDLIKYEDICVNDFINKLLDYDYKTRFSIENCINSDYLTIGLSLNHQQQLLLLQVKEQNIQLPMKMNPLLLHKEHQSIVPLLNKKLKSSSDSMDQQWSRRQFSVLWAPMPEEYDMKDDINQTKGAVNTSSSHAADVWLMTNAYKLSPITESHIEQNSRFKT